MTAPQVIVVSPRGSGTPLLAGVTTALGHTPYGTMSGAASTGDEHPGPGKVLPLLAAAYGRERAAGLLHRQADEWGTLQAAFQEAVGALWRVWWRRLGQPVTLASPVDPVLEDRLSRVPDEELPGLLPGRGCWYVNSLDLQRADGGFLRAWHATGQPPVVFHHRDLRDRIISQIRLLSRPAGQVGSLPDHLVYRDIVSALPTMDAKITLALTDPGFPGMRDARECLWLLRHPAVHVITHEDLAGPAHGGTAEARQRALTRLLAALGHPGPPSIAAPDDGVQVNSVTGAGVKGVGGGAGGSGDGPDHDDLAVGVWRRHFTAEHERLLDRYHGDLLTAAPAVRITAPRSGDDRRAASGG
jgi:hypothetical protein